MVNFWIIVINLLICTYASCRLLCGFYWNYCNLCSFSIHWSLGNFFATFRRNYCNFLQQNFKKLLKFLKQFEQKNLNWNCFNFKISKKIENWKFSFHGVSSIGGKANTTTSNGCDTNIPTPLTLLLPLLELLLEVIIIVLKSWWNLGL